jgi:hypothetical protein
MAWTAHKRPALTEAIMLRCTTIAELHRFVYGFLDRVRVRNPWIDNGR